MGIPRYIAKLFEQGGTTFPAFVLAQLFRHARNLLDGPTRAEASIGVIALAGGFGILPFSRITPFGSRLVKRVPVARIAVKAISVMGSIDMTISMYQASVPRLANILGNLSNILDKAQAHIDARRIDVSVIMDDRLFPDMYPFSNQVQIACDKARSVVARLAGMDVPYYEGNEKTFTDLKRRIAKTIAFIQSVPPERIDGTEDTEIVLPVTGKETRYTGIQLLLGHSMPNVYFHATTAYNILRRNGIEIGKRDFLGNP